MSLSARLLPALAIAFAGTAQAQELFFSEYIEGSSNNKALEIVNLSAATENLATGGYNVQMFFNGNPVAGLTINLTGLVAAGDVFVLAQASANATILAQADQTSSAGWFNGDDAVVLRKGTMVIDAIGQAGFDPGTEWGIGLVSTADNTLRRKCGVMLAGDAISNDPFDPSAEWDGFATDTFDGLGTHCPPPPPPPVCGDPATLIHDIQGSGLTSPLLTTVVEIEGVVVGDYQGAGQLGGFYVQEEAADADADPATSEGIFVFNTSFPVSTGDQVRVRGNVTEFGSSGATLTELTSVNDVSVCSSGNPVTAATVTLPVGSLSDWEAFEGMLIDIPQDLTATETFTLGRFGEVALSVGARLLNPTMVTAPGAPALALQDLNDRSRILLDDGNNQQNIDPTIHPTGGLSALNTLRSGYTVGGLTGVLDQRFGVYRVQPVGPVSFNAGNPRPAAPDAVGGRVKVAAMNVLNYFTTIDTPPGPDICGPEMNLDCRGADSSLEFTRQRDKIINAILGLDADVVGLMEIENNAAAAVQDLVSGLNLASAAGTYDFIDTGTIGTDAIKVGLVYRADTLAPVGAHAILDSAVDQTFIDTLNRPVLAQTFEESLTGERFTVAVNHLKSKGSPCDEDPDTGDGQGNCNLTRTSAANALVNWLATDPTSSGDPDFLIIGDLNSYAMEDPIAAIQNASYVNLIETFVGSQAYSFVFQGQSGYLDHALASPSLLTQTSGATEWHINADEPIALDYNTEFKSANHFSTLYDPGPYRSSDHDPLVVGLDLDQTPPTLNVSVSPNVLWPPNHKYVTVNATVSVSDNVDPNPALTLLSVTSNEPDNAPGDADGNTISDIRILNDFTFRLRAERSEIGSGRVYTITYQATDAHGNSTVSSATVTVPISLGAGG